MTELGAFDAALARIFAAPKGPEVGAFFDYDGTVITGYSASAFYAKRFREFDIGPRELVSTLLTMRRGVHSEEEFASMLDVALQSWAGRTEQEIAELGAALFRSEVAGSLHTEVWELVAAHHMMGHTVVLASSASRFQVEPMARELEIDHLLHTRMEVRDGVLTGRTEGRPLWGPGKAAAVVDFAREHGVLLDGSFAYGNGEEDVPFLAVAGHPLAVAPEDGLRVEADRRGWPVLDCVPRGKRPGVLDVARTAGYYGTWGVGLGVGVGVGLLNRSRRQAWEVARSIGTDVGLAVAGVDVRVVAGRENLTAARPCVAIFNHQNNLDGMIVLKLLGEGCTGASKKEVKYVPGFGQLFQLGDFAFIDRGSATARDALAPAVERIRDKGLTLVLSPEGTRSPTPRLGPFKKGAFHVAMQAGVPMLPLVLRGGGEVQWRGSKAIRSGTVEVVVLPPVDTSTWKPETVGRHVEDVRAMYVDTLAAWPTARGGRP